MFTLEQIREAHTKVKHGGDFPAYVQFFKSIGVRTNTLRVVNGVSEYTGDNGYRIQSEAKYEPIAVNDTVNARQFAVDLKNHQMGGSDFKTFIAQAAASGVHHWTTDTTDMTVTYVDTQGNPILVEHIPSP